eukprot:6380821-Pyramimonas_sp.AAC.1
MGAAPPFLSLLLGARGRLQHVQRGSHDRPVAADPCSHPQLCFGGREGDDARFAAGYLGGGEEA